MNYQTLEVHLENGMVRPCGAEALPAKAHALLTIFPTAASDAEPTAGVSLGDLVRDLAGIGRGDYTDLSTNKAHLDDFGR